MTEEEQETAKCAWYKAEQEEEEGERDADMKLDAKELGESGPAISQMDAPIRARMQTYMGSRLTWTHRELHDVTLSAGFDIPMRPSLLNYSGKLKILAVRNTDLLIFILEKMSSALAQKIKILAGPKIHTTDE